MEGVKMPAVVETKVEPKEESVLKLHQSVAAQSAVQARAAGEHMLKYSPSRYAKYLGTVDLASKYKVGVTPPPKPTLPTQLGPFNSGTITFDNGVPVGGWMTLALFEDGTYSFSGHFHDSGFPSYDVDAVWVIVSSSGKAFTFEVKGSMYGTVDSGSRDYDFAQNGQNDQIKDAWAELCAGYTWRWSAYVNWDVQAAVDDVVSALKAAGTIIAAVVAVVAAF
jgi:hypothetical protein